MPFSKLSGRRLIAALAGAAFAAALATQAAASSSQAGTISAILPLRHGVVLFNHSGSRTATPACHTIPGRWAIDASTTAGQAALSVLMSAYLSGKQIAVLGQGNCSSHSDTEAVEHFVIVD
ncbi:hypothetical protein V7S57_15580 [Caulobacter sp. CCNWLY153]|uniref:Uncharacterized protein n=1 Tax=Caulobacter radicis TaxID=2172650 RepID=A0A2T9IXU7_9CAUL|nr:hypothetical protein [Caulobacter radicis]PVM71919.1 hypothetical protein DDF65_22755 [Caulobacter radicis]